MKNNARQRFLGLPWEHNFRKKNETNANIAMKLLHQIQKNLPFPVSSPQIFFIWPAVSTLHTLTDILAGQRWHRYTKMKMPLQYVTFYVKCFISFGVPEEDSCDGGLSYDSHELKTFLKAWRICLRISSVYYPQSNGRAEAVC